jgi:Protein-tyrosine phosphatase
VQEWDEESPGVLLLPSGRRVRGRGLRSGPVAGPAPEFGLYLQGKPPPRMEWPNRWVRWPDWWLPADRDDAWDAIVEVWRRAENERVEIACSAGRGRTGTVLACLAVIDGIPSGEAVAYVRRHYHPKAVETPWQQWYVRRFQP